MSVKPCGSDSKACGDPKKGKSVGSKIKHFFNFTKKEKLRRAQAQQQGDNKQTKNMFGIKAPAPKLKKIENGKTDSKPGTSGGQGDGKNGRSRSRPSPSSSVASSYSTSVPSRVSSVSSLKSAASRRTGASEGSASSPISVSSRSDGRSTGSATSPMSTVDTDQSIGSATSPSSPSPSEVQHKRINSTAVATMKLGGDKSKESNAKSKQADESSKTHTKWKFLSRRKKRTKKRTKTRGKDKSSSEKKSEPAEQAPLTNPDDNRPLDNIYWVTYFQNRMTRQNDDTPRVRRALRQGTPRPLTRRGPRGILPGMSDLEPYKDASLKRKKDIDVDAGIDRAIDRLADKLLAHGSSSDDKTNKNIDHADANLVEQVIRTRRLPNLPSTSKEKDDTLNALDEYISNIENLIEIQAVRRLLAGVMPRGFRGDVMCPKCRLINRKDPAKEFFLSNRLRNVLCRKHATKDRSSDYHDEVTDDVDRLLHDLEESWWYR